MNEDIKADIRRYRKNLVITGFGFISIELWAVLKFAIRIFEEGGFRKILDSGDGEVNWFLIYFMITAFIVLTTLLHLYIGLSSARYGSGKSKRWGFLVAAGLYIGFTVYEFPDLISDFLDALSKEDPFTTADTSVASILVELTILFILLDMILSAILLKRAEKKLS